MQAMVGKHGELEQFLWNDELCSNNTIGGPDETSSETRISDKVCGLCLVGSDPVRVVEFGTKPTAVQAAADWPWSGSPEAAERQ